MSPTRVALFGLLALAVLGAELPEIHAHDGETPGFYNTECPLARLAVPSWGLVAFAPRTLSQPSPVADSAPSPAPVPPARPAGSAFAPRAPPAAS
jgi:hypothetical protein